MLAPCRSSIVQRTFSVGMADSAFLIFLVKVVHCAGVVPTISRGPGSLCNSRLESPVLEFILFSSVICFAQP